VSQNVQNVFNRFFDASEALTRLGAALQSSSRNLQSLVDDVQAAGVTECGAQVERPVVSCARPGEVVLEAHLVRAFQDKVANGFWDATFVTVSGIVAAIEFQLLV